MYRLLFRANAEPSLEETKKYRQGCVPSHDSGNTLRKSSERFIKCEELNVGKETKRTVLSNSRMECSPWHGNDQSRPNIQHGDTNSKPSDLEGIHLNNNTRTEIYYHEDPTIGCYNEENNDCKYCDGYGIKKSVSDKMDVENSEVSQKEYLMAGEENFTEDSAVQKK